jgi:group II intron reverse transcriptase/maturase
MSKEERQSHVKALAGATITIHRGGEKLTTKLARIAQIAKENPKEKFTSLAHLIDERLLLKCHHELKNGKATGVDRVTKEMYESKARSNIAKLYQDLRFGKYKPQPVRRVRIPKTGSSKMRPLGIPAYEDKIVQLAVSKILIAIYEQDFLNFSHGFRPNRGCHGAIKQLNEIILFKRVNWVVDADISGFFDHVDHHWMIRCLQERIKDPSLLRMITRMLKAGVVENGIYHQAKKGTPQGGIISPILANIYLHYVLDLWVEKVVKKRLVGEAEIVRYADDFVCCFQYKEEAEKFYRVLRKRLNKFGLKLAEEKSKIINFGRFADRNCRAKGKKPDTFDFLGFTHYCGYSRNGKFRVKRKTSRKKYQAALARMKAWIKLNRTLTVKELIKKIGIKLMGHYRYYGISDNTPMLHSFHYHVRNLLFKWLNRRSQRNSYTWVKFRLLMEANPFPKPKVYVSLFES